MKPIVLQTIRLVANCFLKEGNKPMTTSQLFNLFLGDVKMADIHYAIRVMVDNKTVAKVTRATYVLTDSNRPLDAYTTFKKKARKPRKVKKLIPTVKLEDKIKEWDAEEARVQVDFQELCEKLQNALAKSYVENDLLEATVNEQRTIIKYLEGKVREPATV